MPDFLNITFASAVKLTHKASSFKLHSHKVNYASGSQQQSVTAFPEPDDPNSLFIVLGQKGDIATRGTPIPCGSVIRLKHLATQKFLHSHLHESPLSRNQEVSAYEGEDTGDHWKVACSKSDDFWQRERSVRLVHVDTDQYLTSSKRHTFGNPIPGQLEVYASSSANSDNVWVAQEGIYFSSQE